MVGKALGHYEIIGLLGKGGMGEVYRARDTKLKREIALKVLPTETAADPVRLERFQREAETVAALNHPNIITVYSVEVDAGVHFLTMELIEGRVLETMIPADGLPLGKIFDISLAMASALATAHAKGIVHRDLKPGNVMISADGRVKVLDFGLAKLVTAEAQLAQSATGATPLTTEGTLVGIAKRLNVAYVLDGSVRKAGNRVRITAQLIHAADGFHLWSETYDRTLDDIFAIQDEIAADVAKHLHVTLLGDAPTTRKTDPEAYALYLQSIQLARRSTRDAFDRSDALLQRVLGIDSDYAPAWSGLAANFGNQAVSGLMPREEGFARAREANMRALLGRGPWRRRASASEIAGAGHAGVMDVAPGVQTLPHGGNVSYRLVGTGTFTPSPG